MKHIAMFAFCLAMTGWSPTAALAHGQNIGACDPAQVVLGEDGGGPVVGMAPQQVQLRHGKFVDALVLNGRQHGGNGGQPTGVLQLRAEEYINRVVVRHGRFVDRLELSTNFGRSIAGGGQGGGQTVLNNIRVLTIGGRSGQLLDQVQITFCRDYR